MVPLASAWSSEPDLEAAGTIWGEGCNIPAAIAEPDIAAATNVGAAPTADTGYISDAPGGEQTGAQSTSDEVADSEIAILFGAPAPAPFPCLLEVAHYDFIMSRTYSAILMNSPFLSVSNRETYSEASSSVNLSLPKLVNACFSVSGRISPGGAFPARISNDRITWSGV